MVNISFHCSIPISHLRLSCSHNRFFALQPDAQVVFGFPLSMDAKAVQNSPRFGASSKFFLKMLDRSLDMIGPADDVLTDILQELGKACPRREAAGLTA